MLDQIDQKIVEMLRMNARASNSEIARKLKVSEGTVRKRISRMLNSGVLRGFTIIPGAQVMVAIILIKVDPEFSISVIEKLKAVYDEVFEWSGSVDLSVRLTKESLDLINMEVNRIREMEGVMNTDTLIRLN